MNWCSSLGMIIGNVPYQSWGLGDWKLGFWSENWYVLVTYEARIRPSNSELIFQLWFDKNRPPNCQIRPPIFLSVKTGKHSHFHLFLFWTAFGVNMKVVDNWVSFLMALVWLENDFWILSYDGNSPGGYWENFMKNLL